MSELNTGLWCLLAVARRHGVRRDMEYVAREQRLSGSELDERQMVRVADSLGLGVRRQSADWAELGRRRGVYPAIAILRNGRSVVLMGPPGEGDGAGVPVVDPVAGPGLLTVERERFCKAWSGRLVLVRPPRTASAAAPFGIRWFLPEILRERRAFRDVGLAAAAMHLLALAIPIFVQLVIDKVLVHQSVSTLQVLMAGVLAALLFDAAFTYLRRYILLFATNKIDIRLAGRTFHHLLDLPIQFFERRPAGVLTKHMQQARRVREFLTGRLFLTLLDATALLVFLPVLFFYSTRLAFVVLLFAGLIAAVMAFLIGPYQRRLKALYEAEGERQSLLVETIHGMRTVKSLALEPLQRQQWERASARTVDTNFGVGKIAAGAQAATGLLEKLMVVAVIGFGAASVFDGTLTVGALVAFQMLATRVSGPLVGLVTLVHEYQEVALSVRMLGEVMNAPTEPGLRADGMHPPLRGRIEVAGVTFRYPGATTSALSDVSFVAEAGAVIGIVGRSGSGKTSLTRLIQGLYPLEEGSIRFDGYDLREISVSHLRSRIGAVLQDSFLFRGTIRDNIAMTRPAARLEEIIAVARTAGAAEFIESLPKGYDAMLEEHADNLSGGQKQRLAIARALLGDPRILILDEATSALDPESEAVIQDNLARIGAGRTLLIVSHRLAMVRDADAILVLEAGRISGFGPHEALLETCAGYRQLWQKQIQTAR